MRSLAFAVGSFRGDVDELVTVGQGDVQTWADNFQSDGQTFESAFQTVQGDFHVPNSVVPGWNSNERPLTVNLCRCSSSLHRLDHGRSRQGQPCQRQAQPQGDHILEHEFRVA